MNVRELIEQLGHHNPRQEVRFAYSYGDHVDRKVTPTVELVEVRGVHYAPYVQDYQLARSEEPTENAVVLMHCDYDEGRVLA